VIWYQFFVVILPFFGDFCQSFQCFFHFFAVIFYCPYSSILVSKRWCSRYLSKYRRYCTTLEWTVQSEGTGDTVYSTKFSTRFQFSLFSLKPVCPSGLLAVMMQICFYLAMIIVPFINCWMLWQWQISVIA